MALGLALKERSHAIDQEDRQQRYERARVKNPKGFYGHEATFVLVNIGLFAINLLTISARSWLRSPETTSPGS